MLPLARAVRGNQGQPAGRLPSTSSPGGLYQSIKAIRVVFAASSGAGDRESQRPRCLGLASVECKKRHRRTADTLRRRQMHGIQGPNPRDFGDRRGALARELVELHYRERIEVLRQRGTRLRQVTFGEQASQVSTHLDDRVPRRDQRRIASQDRVALSESGSST